MIVRSSDGLDLKRNTRSTLAYKKADINFAEYDKVQISSSTVAFKKNWQRDYNRNTTSLSSRVKKDVVNYLCYFNLATKVFLNFANLGETTA